MLIIDVSSPIFPYIVHRRCLNLSFPPPSLFRPFSRFSFFISHFISYTFHYAFPLLTLLRSSRRAVVVNQVLPIRATMMTASF